MNLPPAKIACLRAKQFASNNTLKKLTTLFNLFTGGRGNVINERHKQRVHIAVNVVQHQGCTTTDGLFYI